jgi:hypothetical protein
VILVLIRNRGTGGGIAAHIAAAVAEYLSQSHSPWLSYCTRRSHASFSPKEMKTVPVALSIAPETDLLASNGDRAPVAFVSKANQITPSREWIAA